MAYNRDKWTTVVKEANILAGQCSREVCTHICNILLSRKSINEELWRITQQKPIENQTKRRKWNWIGHTLCKQVGAIEKTALDWNRQGYRRRGRPKRMWQRIIEDEVKGTRKTWNESRE